jgi:hypothetical protein
LQERITFLGKKTAKMNAELSKVLRVAEYANVAEFFTKLLRCVRRNGSMRRLVRYAGRMNVLGQRLVSIERHSVMRKQ